MSLVPLFALIALGYALKRWVWRDDAFWRSAESLTYFLFFPALLLANTARAEIIGSGALPAIAALVLAILIIAGIAILGRSMFAPGLFPSAFQGCFRPNTYIAIGTGAAVFGPVGAEMVTICMAVSIPLVNLLAIAGFALGDGADRSKKGKRAHMAAAVFRNPLVLACAAGIAVNLPGLGLPGPSAAVVDFLARAALPLGLLAVGAGLDFHHTVRHGGTVATVAAAKLLVLPFLAIGIALGFGLDGPALAACAICSAAPVSPSSFILARQLGGDAPLTSGMITATTAAAAVTIPLLILWL